MNLAIQKSLRRAPTGQQMWLRWPARYRRAKGGQSMSARSLMYLRSRVQVPTRWSAPSNGTADAC
eukprot:scaffold447419_cov31-Prasinocladus_malaysianus.AAC.1